MVLEAVAWHFYNNINLTLINGKLFIHSPVFPIGWMQSSIIGLWADKGLSHFSISALKQIGNWYSYYANYTRQGLCDKIIYAKVCHCRHYTNTNVHHTFNFQNQLFKTSMICPLICVIVLVSLFFCLGYFKVWFHQSPPLEEGIEAKSATLKDYKSYDPLIIRKLLLNPIMRAPLSTITRYNAFQIWLHDCIFISLNLAPHCRSDSGYMTQTPLTQLLTRKHHLTYLLMLSKIWSSAAAISHVKM